MMTVPNVILVIGFTISMLLGGFVVVYALVRLTKRNAASHVSLPGLKMEIKGPAWLVAAFIGALMVASPLIVAAFQKNENVTAPPPPASVQQVRKIDEPNYDAFRFLRDTSILDLRATISAPWYTDLPGWTLVNKKPRIRPAVLKNYMIVKKVRPTKEIRLTYGTSGRLDVRCLTQQATIRRAEHIDENSKVTETIEIVADVSSVPVGDEFEIMVEATYWNAFEGQTGDDYTTYGHNQTEAEQITAILLFPEDKPFKNISVTEYEAENDKGSPFQGMARIEPGGENQSYFWSTSAQRPNLYYKFAWAW